jgi:hypothetical protein
MEKKITKGFLATKKGHLVRVTVSVHDLGFYTVVEGYYPDGPKQFTRKNTYRTKLLVNMYKTDLQKNGYLIKELGEHHVQFDKLTGMLKVKI